MAQLSADPERARRAAERSCGACSACCTVLRVDELAKPAGVDCEHQRRDCGGEDGDSPSAGCGIHETRPPICRAYHCLWLQGGLEDDERPDRTGGIVDLEAVGAGVQLSIREIRPGAFDDSPGLQGIADRYRSQMPVRVTDTADLENPDRPFRVLLAGGREQRVAGDRVEVYEDGVLRETRRLPWLERAARRLSIWRRQRALQRIARGR